MCVPESSGDRGAMANRVCLLLQGVTVCLVILLLRTPDPVAAVPDLMFQSYYCSRVATVSEDTTESGGGERSVGHLEMFKVEFQVRIFFSINAKNSMI